MMPVTTRKSRCGVTTVRAKIKIEPCFVPFIDHMLLDPAKHLDVVTLNFFEKGHTFMGADSFHHTVEEEIRTKSFYAISKIS